MLQKTVVEPAVSLPRLRGADGRRAAVARGTNSVETTAAGLNSLVSTRSSGELRKSYNICHVPAKFQSYNGAALHLMNIVVSSF